jgi:site-specific recombinase XerD
MFNMSTDNFLEYLRKSNLSENTVSTYMRAVSQYFDMYGDVTRKKLKDYRVWLLDTYKPKSGRSTATLRASAGRT